jgi:hypothetical protein
MALKMKMLAPDLWNILGLLLIGDKRSQRQCAEKDSNGDLVMADTGEDDDLWEGLPEIAPDETNDSEMVDENGTFTQLNPKKKAARQDAICTTVCYSHNLPH